MKKTLLVLLMLCIELPTFAYQIDSLLHLLDRTMQQSAHYMEKKQQIIDVAKKKSELAQSPLEQFRNNYDIANLYLGFQYDSACVYSQKSLDIAHELQQKELLQKAMILRSDIMSSAGLFVEAKELLDSIGPLTPALSFSYYSSCERLYANLCDYHETSEFVLKYRNLLKHAYEEAFHALPQNTPLYYLYAYRICEINQEWDRALKMAEKYVSLTEEGTQPHAVALGCVAEVYKHLGDTEKREEYLIRSVISDVTSATKENSSMLQLSILLYNKGHVERAYRYIKAALEDANFYNARFRNLQVSKSLPIIENAYQQATAAYKRNLLLYIALIGILCLLLIGIIIKLRTKNKKINALRQQLTEQNQNLKHLAEEQKKLILLQSSLNKEIEHRNDELSIMTSKYKEVNHIKEEYLGHFLQMCSNYITKLNEYRKTINRKLIAGQYQELVSFTSSSKYILTEKDELYRQFDAAFLHLYPTFVRQLNELLLPGEQIELKSGESLSYELRICALLRLGITDSSKIAVFLGYTPSTVYTYRTKMRNRAKNRDNFEIDILKIS